MADFLSVEAWVPRRKKREIYVCIPTRMGQETWLITLDRSKGHGEARCIWDDDTAKAFEEEQRRLEADLSDADREMLDALARKAEEDAEAIAMVQNCSTRIS